MSLDVASRHELWRLQLLDELRRKLTALEYEPQLDPEGRRRAALGTLIAYFEGLEAEAMEEVEEHETAPSERTPATRASIVVAHASKRGSTAEVARAVAKRLRERGLHVDLRAAADVDDVEPYDGAVLGGSLYFGRWHGDALAFLRRHRGELSERPLAVFALGPLAAEAKDVAESREQVERALAKAPEVEPVAVAVFGGVIDPAKLRFPFNRMPASDARDWAAIVAWADEIASVFAAREVRT